MQIFVAFYRKGRTHSAADTVLRVCDSDCLSELAGMLDMLKKGTLVQVRTAEREDMWWQYEV